MRKTLLFAAALCLASTAMAQTSVGTALTAKTGDNTYWATSQSDLYWKFTPDKDYVATVTPIGDVTFPEVSILGDDESLTSINGVMSSDWASYMYALQAGKTYIFKVADALQSSGFSLAVAEAKGLGNGLTEDSPATIELGETQTFGNPTYSGTGNYNVYTTYTAKEAGQLRIKTAQAVTAATVNGTKVSAVYSGGATHL